MFLIPCPHCGPRAQAEFTYERSLDSLVALDAEPADAVRNLFERDNPRGPTVELWRHNFGCRAWVRLHRDSLTQAISKAEAVGIGHVAEGGA
jgi:sarcosine oxidase subunit delta